MTNFKDLGLSDDILRAVSAEGYTTPTPIQTKVIPAMLAGNDLLGIAQTGTGKTAAFVLPLLQASCQNNHKRPAPRKCHALILTPTRELAAQINDNIDAYGKNLPLSAVTVVGGVKPGPQVRALAHGADIVVATPGRLLDHLQGGAIDLRNTTHVILDEADQMLDLGFLPSIRRIFQKLPKKRQTVLMSATMSKQIRKIASDFLSNPQEISVARVSRPIERIDQSVHHIPSSEKREALVKILSGSGIERAIVFTRTKRGADRVSKTLTAAGLSSAAIHGNKSQNQRQKTLNMFREGYTKILVATDIAARGIDVDGVSHVVNFELPNVSESYVHRIGRTARAGKTGTAISLCDPSERPLLRDIEKLIGNQINSANPDRENSDNDTSDSAQEKSKRADAPKASNRRTRPTSKGGDADKKQGAPKRRRRRARNSANNNTNTKAKQTSRPTSRRANNRAANG